MRIEKISYQKIFPTGLSYLNHRIGLEIQLDEGDSIDEAFKLAKEQVERWNLESNPGFAVALEYSGLAGTYSNIMTNSHEKSDNPETKEKRISLLIGDINSCEELKVLESYKLIVKQLPELQATYEKKLKQLSKKVVN